MDFNDKIKLWKEKYDKVLLIKNSYKLVAAPKVCPRCNAQFEKLIFIYLERGKDHRIMLHCSECGFGQMVQMNHNASARTNTKLATWSNSIKHRDGEQCKVCASTDNLESHHIIPVSVDSERMYDKSNGICLCKKCHDIIHTYMRKVEEIQKDERNKAE